MSYEGSLKHDSAETRYFMQVPEQTPTFLPRPFSVPFSFLVARTLFLTFLSNCLVFCTSSRVTLWALLGRPFAWL